MATELYSKRDIERHLDLAAALDVVERTYTEGARGRVLNPAKSTMHLGDDGEWPAANAFSIGMPAYVDWLDVVGMKWAVATWDAASGPPISSCILLFDLDRGVFTSILEGMHITGVRTALQSVVGLKYLRAEQPESVGIFGAGFQARFQLSVIDALTDVETVRVFDVEDGRAAELKRELDPETDAEIVVAASGPDVASSDAVITVTDSKTPVLEESWLEEAAFIIALGSYRELPDETVFGADRIVVDHPEQCLQRGALSDLAARGEVTEADLNVTIGAMLDEGSTLRIHPEERVLFVPIGLGSLDVAIAEHLRTNGMEDDAVQRFEFL